MFRYEEISAFYLFGLIPIMAAVYIWSSHNLRQRIRRFGKDTLVRRLIQGKVNKTISLSIFALASVLLVIAAVNPQHGLKKEKVKVENSDIFIALDISNSMNATDISPSRLEKAKKTVEQLIASRKGDQIGLILFAGGAYLQMPLTTDYAAAQMFVRAANTDMAGTQGTAISEAIQLAMKSTKEKAQKALIVFSDGEDHDQDAIAMTKKAANNGWTIFTVGAGSEEGSFIPVINNGREEFITDEDGNPVRSQLNQALLREMAQKGNGTYYTLSHDTEAMIQDISIQLDKMQKRAVEVKSFTDYVSYYQYFLGLAVILLLTEFFIFSKSENRA